MDKTEKAAKHTRSKNAGSRRYLQICQYVIAMLLTPLALAVILYLNFELAFAKTKENALARCAKKVAIASANFNKLMIKGQYLLTTTSHRVDRMIEQGKTGNEIEKALIDLDSDFRKHFYMNFIMLYGVVNGEYVSSGAWYRPPEYDHTLRPWYVEAMRTNGKTVLVPPYLDTNTGHVIVSLATLLSDKKSVIAIDQFFSEIMHFSNSQVHDDIIEWNLLNNKNRVLRSKSGNWHNWRFSEPSPDVSKYIYWFRNKINIPETVTIDGNDCSFFFSELIDDWGIFAVINHEKLRSEVFRSLRSHFVTSIAITVLVWLFLSVNLIILQRAKQKVEDAERAKSFFFATVSHDIRTPLNSIIGFSQLLMEGKIDKGQTREYLNDIIVSGNLLMQLINDILDLSKLDAEKIEFHYGFCDFEKLVSEITPTFMPMTITKNNKLEIHIDKSIPFVKIDPYRIRQILFNLISNAVKFTSCGIVSVTASFEKTNNTHGKLICSVNDDGIGISKENIAKILKPFMQVGDGSQGTGLGLSICNKLISQMDGKLSVESEPGKGSKFTVTMSNVEYSYSEAETGIQDVKESPQPSTDVLNEKHLQLLLVDDIPLNLKVVSRMIANITNADCTLAKSGAEALDWLSKKSFDAVLTDIQMPEMNGEELLLKIRENEALKDLKVFAVSADVNMLNTWGEKGFSGLLLKPITIERMTKFIHTNLLG